MIRAAEPSKKALLIVPGVCGNSNESYIMNLADEARKSGFNVLVINPTAPARHETSDQYDIELESVDFSKNVYIKQACD